MWEREGQIQRIQICERPVVAGGGGGGGGGVSGWYIILFFHVMLLVDCRCSLVPCAPSFVSCPHGCCSVMMMMMMMIVASSETLVLVYQDTRRHIPEGLLFTSAAVRASNLAFLRSRHKEKREGQVCVPVLTGRGRFVFRYLQGIILFVKGFGSW